MSHPSNQKLVLIQFKMSLYSVVFINYLSVDLLNFYKLSGTKLLNMYEKRR